MSFDYKFDCFNRNSFISHVVIALYSYATTDFTAQIQIMCRPLKICYLLRLKFFLLLYLGQETMKANIRFS